MAAWRLRVTPRLTDGFNRKSLVWLGNRACTRAILEFFDKDMSGRRHPGCSRNNQSTEVSWFFSFLKVRKLKLFSSRVAHLPALCHFSASAWGNIAHCTAILNVVRQHDSFADGPKTVLILIRSCMVLGSIAKYAFSGVFVRILLKGPAAQVVAEALPGHLCTRSPETSARWRQHHGRHKREE